MVIVSTGHETKNGCYGEDQQQIKRPEGGALIIRAQNLAKCLG
jgi:hypothetical protein